MQSICISFVSFLKVTTLTIDYFIAFSAILIIKNEQINWKPVRYFIRPLCKNFWCVGSVGIHFWHIKRKRFIKIRNKKKLSEPLISEYNEEILTKFIVYR